MNAGPFEVGLLEAYNHVCHLMTLQRLMAPSKGHRRSENTAAAAAAAAEAAPDDHRSGALEDDEEEPALEEEEGGTDVEAEAAAPQQVPTASSYEDVWQSAVDSLPNRDAVAGFCMSMGVATSARNRLFSSISCRSSTQTQTFRCISSNGAS